MENFNGTVKEFKRYLGPSLRNIVQQIAKKQKAAISTCEHCGAEGALDAAHIHGRTRANIIDLILGTSEPNAPVHVNLREFEIAFKREHDPLEKPFLFLCRHCHKKYDSGSIKSISDFARGAAAESHQVVPESSAGILPITLEPNSPDDFKARLMVSREAVIDVYYRDGKNERRPWSANRFKPTCHIPEGDMAVS